MYLTDKQVAEQYPIALPTLRNWRFQGKGPCFIKLTPGRKVLYRKEDVEKFLLRHRITTENGE